MSYHYDKQKKQKQTVYIVGVIFLLLVFFTPIFRIAFDVIEQPLAHSWIQAKQSKQFSGNFFQSWYNHQQILRENQELKNTIAQLEVDILRTDYLADELEKRADLYDSLQSIIPAHIIKSLGNDELIIDQGKNNGITPGDVIVAFDHVLIGQVFEVYDYTARVDLLSNQTIIDGVLDNGNEYVAIEGHGKNNYLIKAPRELTIEEGDIVYSQNHPGYIIGIVSAITFDPRDPFKKVYLSLPINMNNVQIIGIKKTVTLQ